MLNCFNIQKIKAAFLILLQNLIILYLDPQNPNVFRIIWFCRFSEKCGNSNWNVKPVIWNMRLVIPNKGIIFSKKQTIYNIYKDLLYPFFCTFNSYNSLVGLLVNVLHNWKYSKSIHRSNLKSAKILIIYLCREWIFSSLSRGKRMDKTLRILTISFLINKPIS